MWGIYNGGIGDYSVPPSKVERKNLKLGCSEGNVTALLPQISPRVPLMIDAHQP